MSVKIHIPLMVMQNQAAQLVDSRFGLQALISKTERAKRVVEEALELAQAVGVDQEECMLIMEHVFFRPVGEISQEHAGVMVSLLASAVANDLDLEAVTQEEIKRVWSIPEDVLQAKLALKRKAMISE